MYKMFDKTCRAVFEDGLRFYEEDVLFDSHVYSANQKVCLELCYNTNGIGFIIGLKPNQPLEKQDLYYFLRVDGYSASLFLVNQMHYQRLQHVSTPISAPKEFLKIEAIIKRNQIILSLDGKKFMYASIDYAINDHHIGIYSQKDNILKRMYIDGKSPELWQTNMQATENGRITFKDNQVSFENCKYPAELVQDEIILEAGDYYINYESEGARVFVYDTRSELIKLDDKNLIDEEGKIHVSERSPLAIHISSKNGYVKNIGLSSIPNAPYIETYLEPTVKDASSLKVILDNIKKLIVEFNVVKECFASLLTDELQTYERGFIEGDHKLIYENGVFYLYYKDQYIDEITPYSNIVFVLKSVEAFIYNITIVTKDNEKIDWFDKKDRVEWLKPSLNSPILAFDANEEPLDLSSSFREVDNRYIFTNTERESFLPEPIIKLQKDSIGIDGIYGIPKTAITYEDKFYVGKKENPNDISAYCKNYIPIYNANLDTFLNQVILYDDLYQFKEIIIDYRKANSYAINFVTEIGKYSVGTTAPYCSYIYSNHNQSQYTPTSYKEEENRYIVLEKGDFSEN